MFDIQLFLEENKITQRELAYKLGYTEEYISRIVNGKNDINIKFLSKLKEVFPQIQNVKTTVPKFTNGVAPLKLEMRNVPLVNRFAYASFVEHYNDQEYIDTLETIPTTELEDGVYYWFEIKGDSMSRLEDPSLNERDQILCRELYPQHWGSLQLSRDLVWVINHVERDLFIKEITKQKGQILTCHSWNPLVPDFEINLKDVRQIFYFRELRKKRLKSYF